MKEIPRISVLMITYKQEGVIKRALDSLVAQKEYLFEVCINDDCSPDGTWNILQEYALKYPDFIKPIRNSRNLGIFENIEATWLRPKGDIVTRLAGDDESPAGYYKGILDYIEANNIDYKNELFSVFCDYKQVNINGDFIVFRNQLAGRFDPIKLHIRKLLSNRGACYSVKVLKRFIPVSEGRSYVAELVQEYQVHLFSKTHYYIPLIGNIYYAQRGVSSRMSKSESLDSHLGTYDRLVPFLEKHHYVLDKKDMAFIKYMKAYRRKEYTSALWYWIKSIDISLGVYGLGLQRILFVIKNRLLKHIEK